MAGGGQVWLTDSKRDPNGARVVNGRLLVSSDGGGGGGGDVNIAEVGGTPVGGGSLPVTVVTPPGGLPVNLVTPTQVDVTGSSVAISGSSSLNPGTSENNLGKRYDDASTATPVGVLGLTIRSDTGVKITSADNDYATLLSNTLGRLWVTWDGMSIDSIDVINRIIPGTARDELGKAEDSPHSNGDTGVAVFAVRQDTATALAGAGDYIPFIVDGSGRLHVNVGAVTPGTAASNLGKAEDAPHVTGDTGVMALGVRQDTATALGANGDYVPPIFDASGRLHANVGLVTPGTAATNLGKAEDAVAANGDTGVAALAVRQDTLASSVSNDGDYATLKVDSLGALWVRMAGMTTIALSGSTRGRPIQIAATATPGTLLHTATTTAGQIDKVYIDLTNTSASAVTVTIEFGTTGAGAEMDIIVPANATVRAVDGAVIGGAATDTIRAFASVGSVVNAVGRVERLS